MQSPTPTLTMDEMALQLVQITETLAQLGGDPLENDNALNGQAQSVLTIIKHLYESREQYIEALTAHNATLPIQQNARDAINDTTNESVAPALSTLEEMFKMIEQLNLKLTDKNFETIRSKQEKILAHVTKLDQALLNDTEELYMQGVLGYLTEETLNLGDQLDRFENKLESTDRRMRSLRDLFVTHGNEFSHVLKLLTEMINKLNMVEERSRYTLSGLKDRKPSLENSNMDGKEMDLLEEQLKNYSGMPPLWNRPALGCHYSDFATNSSVSVLPLELELEFEKASEIMNITEPVVTLAGKPKTGADTRDNAYPEQNQTSEKILRPAMSTASMTKTLQNSSAIGPSSSGAGPSNNTGIDPSKNEIVEAKSKSESTHPPGELQADISTTFQSAKEKTEKDARNLRGNLWSQKPQTWTSSPQGSRCNSLSTLDAETLSEDQLYDMLESPDTTSPNGASSTAGNTFELLGDSTPVSELLSDANPHDLTPLARQGGYVRRPFHNYRPRPGLEINRQNDGIQSDSKNTMAGPWPPLGKNEQEPRHEIEPIPGSFTQLRHTPNQKPKPKPQGGPRLRLRNPSLGRPRIPKGHTPFALTECGVDSVEEQQAQVIQNSMKESFELPRFAQHVQARRMGNSIGRRQFAVFLDFLNHWFESQANQGPAFVANTEDPECAKYKEDQLYIAIEHFSSDKHIEKTPLMNRVIARAQGGDYQVGKDWRNHKLFLVLTMISVVALAFAFCKI